MSTQLVYGSLQDVATRSARPIAETFLSVDALIMVDTSGSMDIADCPGQRKRYDIACEQLIRLQRELPGKVGVISWNSNAYFCPGGLPTMPVGGTDLVNALEFIKPADGTTIKLILISDGEPDNELEALRLAKEFKSKISTIYCGPEIGFGQNFLRALAEATGGQAVSQSINQLNQLSQTVTKLLTI